MNSINNNKKNETKYEALSIAKYLLSLDKEYFDNEIIENKINLSSVIRGNFRLNQMLYLLQVLYYLENKQLLFKDKLYAWENGIVVYNVYTHFWSLYNNINGKEIEDVKDKEIEEFIEKHFKHLKKIPDKVLQEFSYNDPARSFTWTKSSQPDICFTDKENLEFYQRFCSRWIKEVRL